jgi:Tol biopolymer transport system component
MMINKLQFLNKPSFRGRPGIVASAFIFSAFSLVFLASVSQKVAVDYTPATVMEEGGVSFIQYTGDDENVVGPYVGVNSVSKFLEWWSSPVIDVSADSTYLGYKCFKNNATNLYLRKLSGGKNIVQRTFRNGVLDFSFSNDGKNIAFSENSDGSENIYLVNTTEGSAVQQITSSPASEVGPYFSMDDKMIFYTKSEVTREVNYTEVKYYVWSFNRESSLVTQYNEGYSPCMHPDGKRLLICRNNRVSGLGEIWSIDIVSGQETLLLSEKDRGFSSPDISKDGKRIVCVGSSKPTKTKRANLDIFTFNIDGTGLTQLTFHPGHDASPRWAPNNNSVFFVSQRGNSKGKWNVWRMNVRQS